MHFVNVRKRRPPVGHAYEEWMISRAFEKNAGAPPSRRAIAVAAVLLPEPGRPSKNRMWGRLEGQYEIAREAMKDRCHDWPGNHVWRQATAIRPPHVAEAFAPPIAFADHEILQVGPTLTFWFGALAAKQLTP